MITSPTFPGKLGLRRTEAFIDLLGRPNGKIIHIAGTSGKGSVAYLISTLLLSQGFKVGLYLSPHIIDIRERIQIDNQWITKEKFVTYLNQLLPFIEKMRASTDGPPSYFELLVGLALNTFKQEKADYIILETGLGGLHDATNIFQDKVAVLTPIGLDHTEILGDTLTEIAFQKAAIIQSKNIVLSAPQKSAVERVLLSRAEKENTKVTYIKPVCSQCSEEGTIFDFVFDDLSLPQVRLGMYGKHQAYNASLALATVVKLSQRDNFILDTQRMRSALEKAHLPGRMEIIRKKGKIVILDGAHNPCKMKSLIEAIQTIFPGKKFDFLIGFKKNKDYKTMVEYLLPVANEIITTGFYSNKQDWVCISEDPENISVGHPIKDCHKALNKALESDHLVITGSFYLLGEIYGEVQQFFNQSSISSS